VWFLFVFSVTLIYLLSYNVTVYYIVLRSNFIQYLFTTNFFIVLHRFLKTHVFLSLAIITFLVHCCFIVHLLNRLIQLLNTTIWYLTNLSEHLNHLIYLNYLRFWTADPSDSIQQLMTVLIWEYSTPLAFIYNLFLSAFVFI